MFDFSKNTGRLFQPKGSKPEARMTESGGKVLGEGAINPLPATYGVWGTLKLPQWGPGRNAAPRLFGIALLRKKRRSMVYYQYTTEVDSQTTIFDHQ